MSSWLILCGAQPMMVWIFHIQPSCLQVLSVACSVPSTSRNKGNFCRLLGLQLQQLKLLLIPERVDHMSIPEYLPQLDSDWSDTDPESLLTEEVTVNVLTPGTGEVIPHTCPVCRADLTSGMALFHHLRSEHPEEKPYACDDCQHHFNNLKELSSHRSNIYRRCKVSCNQCAYRTTTKAKLHQHICIHTRGVPCPQCGWSFPMLTEMLWHKYLHSERQTFECSECNAVYHTLNSLRIHQIRKHGEGYTCEMCDRCFDTPVQ